MAAIYIYCRRTCNAACMCTISMHHAYECMHAHTCTHAPLMMHVQHICVYVVMFAKMSEENPETFIPGVEPQTSERQFTRMLAVSLLKRGRASNYASYFRYLRDLQLGETTFRSRHSTVENAF